MVYSWIPHRKKNRQFIGLNKMNLIIGLSLKGQPTFVKEGESIQVGQADLFELVPMSNIWIMYYLKSNATNTTLS